MHCTCTVFGTHTLPCSPSLGLGFLARVYALFSRTWHDAVRADGGHCCVLIHRRHEGYNYCIVTLATPESSVVCFFTWQPWNLFESWGFAEKRVLITDLTSSPLYEACSYWVGREVVLRQGAAALSRRHMWLVDGQRKKKKKKPESNISCFFAGSQTGSLLQVSLRSPGLQCVRR